MADVDWPQHLGGPGRSGVGPLAPALDRIGPAWTATLDGALYGEALVAGGRVYAATENNTVYALSPADGKILWQAHFGDPIPKSQHICGNIDPTGITSTPVIDPATATLYALGFIEPAEHELYALNAATGAVRWHVNADPPGVDVLLHQQRAALTLANGYVYVPYGGLIGDCGQYTGWVVGVPASGTGPNLGYKVPARREAAIWAPAGGVVDDAGSYYVATGNAAGSGAFDHGNAVVRLSPALVESDVWAPANWAQLSAQDTDIGSISPALLPGGLIFQTGKSGRGYLLRADHLGGISGEVFSGPVCSGGAFGGQTVSGSTVYVPCGGGITALTVAGDRFTTAWRTPGPSNTPILAGGWLWAVSSGGSATLFQLNPADGSIHSRTPVGLVEHFVSPSAGAGHLFLGAGTRLLAFTPV